MDENKNVTERRIIIKDGVQMPTSLTYKVAQKESKAKPIDYALFTKALDEAFGDEGMSQNDFGDDLVKIKSDLILYIMVRKGIITLDELVGNSKGQGSGTSFEYEGLIKEFMNHKKDFLNKRR